MRWLPTLSIRTRLLLTVLLASSLASATVWGALAILGWRAPQGHALPAIGDFAIALAAGWIVGLLTAFQLQRCIAAPLDQLAERAATIARDRDFSIRLTAAGSDETGRLTTALNALLAEIDARTTALRDRHLQLEQHIAERTLELRQEVAERTVAEVFARRARETAETANAAKDEFLSRMSHELRTPLNAILGFGQLLEMDTLTEEQSGEVSQILHAGHHLLGLVNDVLDISRLSTGEMSLDPQPIPLGDSLAAALAANAALAIAADVHLPDFGDLAGVASRAVLADRDRLDQVLIQLISNAVKFNRPGGEVRIAAFDSCDRKLRIEIADTGIGIAPEMLARLWTPFDRLDTAELEITGTGIGLVLARQLVQAMSGTLTAKSNVGVGTTFAIELPLAETAVAPAAADAVIIARPRTILYVEAGLPHLAVIESALADFPKSDLLCAATGWAALDAARIHMPDLILLDLHLPDVAGTEMLARLKASPQTRDVPVAILCAETTPRQIAQLLQAGASHFLAKPLDPWRVSSLLEETLFTDAARELA